GHVRLKVVDAAGADDGCVDIGMREGKAKDELHSAHAVEEVVEACRLPDVVQLLGLWGGGIRQTLGPVLLVGGSAASNAAADYGTRAGTRGVGDRRFVLPLHGRVGDLEDIEYAQRNVMGEARQGRGNANEADLA